MIKIVKIKSNPLYFAILVLIIKTIMSYSLFWRLDSVIDNLFSFFATFFLIIYIIFQKYNIRTSLIYFTISVIALILCINIHSTQILITILMCITIRKGKFNEIIKMIFQYEFIMVVILVLCSIIYASLSGVNLYYIIGGYTRYHFGFVHPNTLSAFSFNLILMWLWIHYETLSVKNYISVFIIESILFYLTKTRTSFLTFIVILLLIIVFKKKNDSKMISKISGYIVPILSLLVFFESKYYTTGNWLIFLLDVLLSGRIRLGAYAYNTVGVTFWGQDVMKNLQQVKWDEVYHLNGFTFDCLYTSLMMNVGIVILIIVSIIFYALSRKKNTKINIFLIAWALYGITEVHGLNCFICFPILLTVFLKRNEEGTSSKISYVTNYQKIKNRV